jgi:predicted Rossmann fold flavoprotein
LQRYDVIVIGGGGAGMMCAFTAGRRARRVALLESNSRLGLKIAISGGGRCNFTNLRAAPENYLSANPRFCISALTRYPPEEFIRLVQKHRIGFHEKKLGQLFCDFSSRQIIEMLLAECALAGVTVCSGVRVDKVERHDSGFSLGTNRGAMECESLVIATGGLSYPRLGASDFGYRIAQRFGLEIVEPRPGLVPFILGERQRTAFAALSGISLPVIARIDGTSFAEAMLVTHRGLSGPAILQISSFWRPGITIRLDLLPQHPGADWLRAARRTRATAKSLLSREWPGRFAELWCEHYVSSRPLAQMTKMEFDQLVELVHAWPLQPLETEGYPNAEVTVGGINTSELSSRTMETRKVPGLFFIGEVVDVTGWLGGYNFQWAWASGHAAGEVA